MFTAEGAKREPVWFDTDPDPDADAFDPSSFASSGGTRSVEAGALGQSVPGCGVLADPVGLTR